MTGHTVVEVSTMTVVVYPSGVVVGPAGEEVGDTSGVVEGTSDVVVTPAGLETGVVSVTGQIVVDTGVVRVVRMVEVERPGQSLTVSAQLMIVETTVVS